MSAFRKEPLSLAVRPGDEKKPPFTAGDLLELGKKYAYVEGIGSYLAEDAAQEFAIAGWKALAKADHQENIRAFQIQAGKWAVTDLLRKECRQSSAVESYRQEKVDAHGDELPEDIADESAQNPLQALIDKEEGERAMALLRELPELERRVVEAIVLEERTQADLGRELALSQRQVSRILRRALLKIREKFVCAAVRGRLDY